MTDAREIVKKHLAIYKNGEIGVGGTVMAAVEEALESQHSALAAKDAENAKQAAEIERLTEQTRYNHIRMEQMLCEIDQKSDEIERLTNDLSAMNNFILEHDKQIEQLQAEVNRLQIAINDTLPLIGGKDQTRTS